MGQVTQLCVCVWVCMCVRVHGWEHVRIKLQYSIIELTAAVFVICSSV